VRFAVIGDFGTGTPEQYELANVMDPRFHVDGERYCWFIRSDVEFFALDSNYLDAAQVTWLKQSLAASTDTVDSGNIVRDPAWLPCLRPVATKWYQEPWCRCTWP
jgi:hypothetical protein